MRRYLLKLICETLVANYGNTLVEHDTDLKMSKSIYRKLIPHLSVPGALTNGRVIQWPRKLTLKEFKDWRTKFVLKNMNLETGDMPSKFSCEAK